MQEKILYSEENLKKYEIDALKSDSYILNCEIFLNIPKIILNSLKAYEILIETSQYDYQINCRYLFSIQNIKNPPILLLHGHGDCCTWTTWLKLSFILFEKGYNCLLLDLPGYGKSKILNFKEKRINPKIYINDSADLFYNLISFFKLENVICIGFCGGAANIIRTISKYPKIFNKRHVLHNSLISNFPENFESIANTYKLKFWITWCQDIDHPRIHYAYKWLDKKRKEKNEHFYLCDIGENELNSFGLWSQKNGRNTSNIMIFDPCKEYLEFIFNFIEKKDNINYLKIKNNEGEEIEKVKWESLKDYNEEDEINKVLELSLNEK